MHISSRVTCALAAVACVLTTAHPTTAPAKPFELTVDSIMRGPKLGGYPPTGPRWARRESAVTFTRDNNLFIVPLDSGTPGSPGSIVQLTDVQPKKRDSRDTDSQKFVKAEEQKLIEHTRIEAEKKKKAEEKEKARALPKFELADRQSAADLQLSPDGTHVFLMIVERTEAAKRPNVPNYVTESSYTEDIPARTFVGDAQDKRTLAVMNLETGKSVSADSEFAAKRELRWSMPIMSDDGTLVVASARAIDNKRRENGKSIRRSSRPTRKSST